MELRLGQRGQTVVEYILLLAVSVSLLLTFYNSDVFKRLFGTQGELGQRIKAESEFGYRHAFMRNAPPDQPRDISAGGDMARHPSYYNSETDDTRFFGPKEPYP